ncbi:MAG: ABC transporter permease [Candidatus Micrarchaeia archaeon]
MIHDTYALYIREMLIFKKNIKTSVGRSLIFPLVLILLLGNLGSTIRNLPAAVVNYDNGVASINLMNTLESSGEISITSITNQPTALQMLANGDVAFVLVIPPGFSTISSGKPNLVVYIDSSSPIASASAIAALEQTAQSFGAKLATQNIAGKVSGMQGQTPSGAGGASLQANDAQSFSMYTNYAYGASESYKDFLIAGIVIMVTAFGSMWSGGISLLTDRQFGNLKTFLVTPINKMSILFSKMASGITQSMISGFIALGIGILDGGIVAGGAVGWIWITIFMFLSAFGFSGIATILGARINKVEVFSLIGMAITMPMWFLSGAFLPTSTLPNFMQPFSIYNPMTYAVDAVRDVMLKGFISAANLLFYSTILIVFGAVMAVLSYIAFKQTMG